MSTGSEETLFLTATEQDAVIGWMIKDTQFMLKCKSSLNARAFSHSLQSELYSIICEFADKYERSPTTAELEGALHYKFHSATDFRQRNDRAKVCIASAQSVDVNVLADKMTDWLRVTILKNAIQESATIYNKKQYDQAREFVVRKMKDIAEADFHQDERVSYADPVAFYKNRFKVQENCCTIGHPDFDEVLKPKSMIKNDQEDRNNPFKRPSTKGGLLPGDMTVLVGPSNAGKTTSVVSVIAQNILMRKFVLVVTHEQKDEDIKDKIYKCITRLTTAELTPDSIDKNEETVRKLNLASYFLENYLVHVHWIKPGKMIIEDVLDVIALRQEKLCSQEVRINDKVLKEFGKGFDLVVDDYPGVLKSRAIGGKNSSTHEEKGYIYRQLLELARQHKFHILVPAQTNRDGFKASQDSDHVLGQGDIADSFQIAQVTDNLITINRGPNDKAKNIIRYYIDKSRSGPTGYTFVSKSDFGTSRAFGPDLACTVFEPGVTAGQQDIDVRLGARTEAIKEGRDPAEAELNAIGQLMNSVPDEKTKEKNKNNQ